jgi:hypothetical protein
VRIFGLTGTFALLLLFSNAPAFAQAASNPEVEKAFATRVDTDGPVPKALHHMSENRFFYAAGFLVLNLLILFSVSKTAPRRIFGTLSVLGLLFVLHYLFIGIALPSLRPDEWEGPITRGIGIRSSKEWKRVPDIGTYFRVVREKNFLGPKNDKPLNIFYSEVVADQTGGKEATVGYGQEFVTRGIKWKPGWAKMLKDGRLMYFWCAEFKQQRVVVVLSIAPGSRDGDKDLAEITTLVGNIH